MGLIGISGKIGSGKDIVGKIIQYLDMTVHYNFKFSFEEYMSPEFGIVFEKTHQVRRFGDKLKQVAALLTGVSIMDFHSQEGKSSILDKEWDYYSAKQLRGVLTSDSYEKLEDVQKGWWDHNKMTIREFLQKLGTEGLRNNLHPNVWVNALFADYKMMPHNGPTRDLKYPDWVVTDVRFNNEAEAIMSRGGIMIRVNRPNNPFESSNHISETGLDNWNFDYIINNDGSIEDLIEKVKEIYNVIKK